MAKQYLDMLTHIFVCFFLMLVLFQCNNIVKATYFNVKTYVWQRFAIFSAFLYTIFFYHMTSLLFSG